jgi:hypothetical protein
MKPIDKFGRPIYSRTYEKMMGFARVLVAHGYKESLKKTNLFYKNEIKEYFDGGWKRVNITFFADMRGVGYSTLWEDASPLFYVKANRIVSGWVECRLAKEEFREIKICRSSFDLMGGDGYCIVCGKDFGSDGFYCSEQCERADGYLMGVSKCRVCGKELDDDFVSHHLSYGENKKIIVCRSCHGKIHMGNKFVGLKPVDKKGVISE